MKLILSLVPAISFLEIKRAEKNLARKSAAVSQLINISIYIEEKIVIFGFGIGHDCFSFAIACTEFHSGQGSPFSLPTT